MAQTGIQLRILRFEFKIITTHDEIQVAIFIDIGTADVTNTGQLYPLWQRLDRKISRSQRMRYLLFLQ